jgi:succinoglycan biosynthesis transport protein ExoP
MKEHYKVEVLSKRPPANGTGAEPLEDRLVETADSYEILEPREASDLRACTRTLRRRLATVLIVFFVFFSVALIATLKQKPVYRAQALLEIQKENPDIPTLKELYELDSVSDAYLRSQYTILGSDSLARRVIDQVGLDGLPEFNSPNWWSWREEKKAPRVFATGASRATQDVYQRVLERFQDRLTINPISRSLLVAVQFDSHDPNLAARVVNSLAENYVDQNLEARWAATQKAADWLSEQLTGVKVKLEKSEVRLQDYARRNNLVFLESDKGPSQNVENNQVQQLQEELTKAEAQRFEKEALYRAVQADETGSIPGLSENKVIQDLTERLAELKREYARLSTSFNKDYPRVKEIQSQADEIEAGIQEQRKKAADQIASEYLAAVRREDLVRQALGREQNNMDQAAVRAVQYNILKREVDTNKQMYEGLLQRLKEAGVSASLKASNIRIVDSAEPPVKPVKPRIPLNLGVAAIFGLGLGICAAFFQERMDDTLKGSGEVEGLLGLSTVGLIPEVSQPNGNHSGMHKLLENSKAPALKENGNDGRRSANWHRIDAEGPQPAALVEAFRSLRTSILHSIPDHPPSTLLVSSTQPGEGKTTVACNLAIALSQVCPRVLLVDADLRSPSLHRLFGQRENQGLVSCLAGRRDWRSVVRQSGLPGLDLLFCGPVPPNPSELLSSQSMGALIRSAREQYEFVILDSAPMLALADSRILATQVSGVLLVVKNAAIPRAQVKQTLSDIRSVGGKVIGVALNNVDLQTIGYYSYTTDGPPAHIPGEPEVESQDSLQAK